MIYFITAVVIQFVVKWYRWRSQVLDS